MISDELLAELKQILWEDYQIQLSETDLQQFAQTLKGLYRELTTALKKKEKELTLIINKNDNDTNTTESSN